MALPSEFIIRSWKNIGMMLCDTKNGGMKRLGLLEFLALKKEGGLTDFQQHRAYPNEFFPIVQWAITNRCNYKCRHCFMMPGDKNSMDEPSLEQCFKLIEQFAACGIPEIYITGGEPLARNDFIQIVDKLIENNIRISLISTNGALVTDALLCEIKKRDIHPTICVSFDGLGQHDWMRGVKGAEEASINALTLAKKHGFGILCEMAVHKGNVDVLLETARFMRNLGISQFKPIRVADSPRWKTSGEDNTLSCEGYYDAVLELLREALEQSWEMDMKMVGFAYFYRYGRGVDILPMKGCANDHGGTLLCKKARSILFVSGDGRLLPCNPFTSIAAGREDWGNAFETPLQELLTESAYLDKVNATLGMLKEHTKKCRDCKWLKDCQGGCRVLAYGYTGDYLEADETKCKFFEGGYVEKIQAILPQNK